MLEFYRLTDSDVPSIMQMEALSFADDHWSEKQIMQQLLNPEYLNVGIKEQGALIGFALLGSVLDEAEIYQITILPAFQGRGWATALLHQLCEELHASGVCRLLLEVKETNLAAIRLYESFGFVLDGRRKGYYATGAGHEDALLYSYAI
jgi:ribosomal-protein-alanine N-acetyltransferase